MVIEGMFSKESRVLLKSEQSTSVEYVFEVNKQAKVCYSELKEVQTTL